MSYCEIVILKNGTVDSSIEYKNSYGGTPYIWDKMYGKYMKNPNIQSDRWMMLRGQRQQEFWNLWKRKDVPLYQKSVFLSTMDMALINSSNFKEFCEHLESFIDFFGMDEKVCHLPQWIKNIQNLADDVEAIGFYGTSVSHNPWFDWNDEKDEEVPFNVFEDLNNLSN